MDDDLWIDYHRDRTIDLRNKLVLSNMAIVRSVLHRYDIRSHDALYGYAVEGLIQAVERYNPGSGSFKSYAYLRVIGAVKDGWREMDRLPRLARESITRYVNKKEALAQQDGHMPTNAEVVKELDLTDEMRYRTAAAIDFATSHLDTDIEWSDGIQDRDKENNPHYQAVKESINEWLADHVSALTEREKIVVTLYYYENMLLKEIGEVLGVSEARISQIHKRAIMTLRERIKDKTALGELTF